MLNFLTQKMPSFYSIKGDANLNKNWYNEAGEAAVTETQGKLGQSTNKIQY